MTLGTPQAGAGSVTGCGASGHVFEPAATNLLTAPVKITNYGLPWA
ncbi:hypothetical protein SAMN05444159_7504 [Bradyrhizobium lablabi]|uniref:Uncharacterized protein n=1 Tax=Bradyrhizobium lablabi TaxID=722472 RepID=A0A1M7FHU4_9BRAD|nr:hypothetical protein SAMN05444159_7504 [Bradyrhizobium lablabi]